MRLHRHTQADWDRREQRLLGTTVSGAATPHEHSTEVDNAATPQAPNEAAEAKKSFWHSYRGASHQPQGNRVPAAHKRGRVP
jgi:hypothetical protein